MSPTLRFKKDKNIHEYFKSWNGSLSAQTHTDTHSQRHTHPVIVELPQGHALCGGHSSTRPSLFKSRSPGNWGGYSAPRVYECVCVCVSGAESTTGASVMGVNGEGVWTSDQFQMSFVILFILLGGGSVKMVIHGKLFKADGDDPASSSEGRVSKDWGKESGMW